MLRPELDGGGGGGGLYREAYTSGVIFLIPSPSGGHRTPVVHPSFKSYLNPFHPKPHWEGIL